jgi:hypothetical protein
VGVIIGNATTEIYPVLVSPSLPPALVAVRDTVNVPRVVYVCVGFWLVDVVPSPKFHDHEVGVLVLASVKSTAMGAFPEVVFAEKAATGAGEVTLM